VAATDADAIGDEPIWHDGKAVGWVTSGGYGHRVGASLALGLHTRRLASADPAIRDRNHRRAAHAALRLNEPPFDPERQPDACLSREVVCPGNAGEDDGCATE
jgi:dimethylglycine dehydrogenase